MRHILTVLILMICSLYIMGCRADKGETPQIYAQSPAADWWESVPPIMIGGDAFYGQPCSVTRVSDVSSTPTERVIFEVPYRPLTYCKESKAGKNYLEQDGAYIILRVDRQTLGAGSWTAERYRSADFETWEEYIGVTWKNGEEYEAWRRLGSTSSKADSLKKVEPEVP